MAADQAVEAVNWTISRMAELGLIENNSVRKYRILESCFGIQSNEQTLSQETPEACLIPVQILMTVQWNSLDMHLQISIRETQGFSF